MQEAARSIATGEVINQFNDAFNRHDVATIMSLMTDDCVFENTAPPPDGERFEGQAAVRRFWEEFFRSSPHAVFHFEETIPLGDRCVVLWRYEWTSSDEQNGHIRGVDVFRVRNGKVAEKYSYVKG